MRKTNPLTKLRFKPQVSAAFASVSILIDADPIDPDIPRPPARCSFVNDLERVLGDKEPLANVQLDVMIPALAGPRVGYGFILGAISRGNGTREHDTFENGVHFLSSSSRNSSLDGSSFGYLYRGFFVSNSTAASRGSWPTCLPVH